MKSTRPATICFDSEIHQALRHKATVTGRTVSELVNEAVEMSLSEDLEDLRAYSGRKDEPTLSFDKVIEDFRRRGRL